MLYNLDWLQPGQLFPPRTEIARLKGYSDNAKLFEGGSSDVIQPYIDRLNKVINRLKEGDEQNITFEHIPEYWQLSTIKTADLMVGDEPNIRNEKMQQAIDDALQNADFFAKLDELIYDNDSLGECIVRPYIDRKGHRNFVAQNPSMWFPIVNEENIKEVIYDVIAWTVCVKQDANNSAKNVYELYVKIQERGNNKIEFRRYKINKHRGICRQIYGRKLWKMSILCSWSYDRKQIRRSSIYSTYYSYPGRYNFSYTSRYIKL